MNRRTLLIRLAMVLIAMAALVTSERASATTPAAPCCNDYRLEIDCSVPSDCFPIKIDTYWLNGAVHTSPVIAGCGAYTIPLVPPLPPCYPNVNNLKYLTINGTGPIVLPNQPTRVIIGGCCYLVEAIPDPATGCLLVRIRRC